jgi:anti-sigma factor RsiW
MAKPAAAKRKKRAAPTPHQHGEGRCLDILRELSAYIDDELSEDLCQEIRRHLGDCPNCEVFVASLRQTLSLCRHHPTPTLTSTERARMREAILKSAEAR